MKKVEDYERIRKAYHIEGLSIREISRKYKHGRRLIHKALENAAPGPYQIIQPRNDGILGSYQERILELLEVSKKLPRKQRYTGHKVYTILETEGYIGCEGSVHNFICRTKKKTEGGKAYLPLEFDAGQDAQVDWGEAVVILGGVEVTVQFFVMRLNYSRVRFVKAYPFQKQEAFLEAHESGFHFNGGVPHRITYDNLKTAVFKILEGHNRQEQETFKTFRSYYLFDSRYCTPAQGHEKGGVESDVGYAQRNFFSPLLQVNSYEELNQRLLECCLNDVDRHIRGQEEPAAELWKLDKTHLLPLPKQDYPACVTRPVKANPYSQAVFETNRYSVPHTYAGRQLVLRAYPFKIEILSLESVIATHPRCFGREQDIFDPMHYLSLLEQRPGAFEHAIPVRQWRKKWPASYERLLRSLQENKPEGQGVREFISILKLHQSHSSGMIERAVDAAVSSGMMGLDGVMYQLQRLAMSAPPIVPLDLSKLPQLANVGCQPVNLNIYEQLVGMR
ncbi:MAG: IS21 family transposase [Desulfuromonadales bacterium]|nr:IS21 family transposase [Desulfuromonadales bacterium]